MHDDGLRPEAVLQGVHAPFADALVRLGERRDDVVVLTADLGKWTDVLPFRERFPERFVQVGMAEQNLVGVAGGLAKSGFLPIAVSYGVFLTRRAFDQIAMCLATGPTHAILVGFLPGIVSRFRATHQATEDVALMRTLPGMCVLDPADATELAGALDAAAEHPGPVYLRANRGWVPRVFDESPFTIGPARLVRDGQGVGVLATGLATVWALEAAEALAQRGVELALLHVPTVKPLDLPAVADFCSRWDEVVCVENHSVVGGLGEAVATVIAERGIGCRLRRLGVRDSWGAYGAPEFVRRALGLDHDSLVVSLVEAARRG